MPDPKWVDQLEGWFREQPGVTSVHCLAACDRFGTHVLSSVNTWHHHATREGNHMHELEIFIDEIQQAYADR